jgi:hypothetical protein
MRSIRLFSLAALLACLPFASASAQTPDTGMLAAGADVGVYFPDNAFENTVTLDAFGEYYLSPRISVRGLLGWATPGFDNRTEDNFRQVRLLFNGVYNWEVGYWRPYVTAGAGAYFVREILDASDDPDGESRGGVNFGGGAEYLYNDMTSVKVEGRWDVVSHPRDLPDATGFTLTVGIKRYF